MKLQASLAVCSVAILAACGGGGGSVSNTPPSTAFNDNYLAGVGVVNAYRSTLTQQASMPVGTHTYNGAAFFKQGNYPSGGFSTQAFDAIINSPDATGAVQLTANFTNNTLSGQITNIAGANGVNASGSLQIGGGVISGTTATAGLSGTIQIPGLSGNVVGTISSNFHGTNGQAIIGTMSGSAAGDGFGGVIAAQR
jgi:hypothetical protein